MNTDQVLIGTAAAQAAMTEPLEEENGVWYLPFTVTENHLNFHNTFHGGMIYFYALEALSQYMVLKDQEGVGMEGSIHYYRAAKPGDRLKACIHERKVGRTVGTYFVEILNEAGKLVADSLFTIMFGRQ